MTTISANTFQADEDQAAAVACALWKVNEMIRYSINEGEQLGRVDPNLDGVDFILDCLINQVWSIHSNLEQYKYWAEDASINIDHARYHGDKTLIRVNNFCTPGVI